MEKSGVVNSKQNKTVIISIYKESACEHCSKCSETSKITNEITYLDLENTLDIGDIVTFEIKNSDLFKLAAIIYVIPLVAMFLGYFVASFLKFSQGICILISFSTLFISFIGIYFYDKFIYKTKVENSIKIIDIKKNNTGV